MLIPVLMLVTAMQQQEVRVDPTCAAEIRWAVSGAQSSGRGANDFRVFTLFGAVAQPSCEPAEIRLTAAFFDVSNELICGGVISTAAVQSSPTQMTTLEFRFTNLDDWVRWRSGPHDATIQKRTLSCLNADGTGPVAQAALDRAASVRVYATILPPFRGMATAELLVSILPGR
jgi:hypothetical protein